MVLDCGDKLKQSPPPPNVLKLALRIPPKMTAVKKHHKYCHWSFSMPPFNLLNITISCLTTISGCFFQKRIFHALAPRFPARISEQQNFPSNLTEYGAFVVQVASPRIMSGVITRSPDLCTKSGILDRFSQAKTIPDCEEEESTPEHGWCRSSENVGKKTIITHTPWYNYITN